MGRVMGIGNEPRNETMRWEKRDLKEGMSGRKKGNRIHIT